MHRSLFILLVFAFAFSAQLSFGQALTGTTSLVRVPSAEIPADGLIRISSGFLHRDFVPLERNDRDIISYAGSIAFLPFLELGFRFNRKLGAVDALGDRMLIARLQVLKETRSRPALLIGLHDFIRSSESLTTKFHAFYLVGSKGIPFPAHWLLEGVTLHLGYASDILDAQTYELKGIFGGVEIAETNFTETVLEYDGDFVNIGQRFRVWKYLELLVAVQDFKQFTGGGSLQLRLK